MPDISNGMRYDEVRMGALATGAYGGVAALVPLSTGDYELVAASDTNEAIGATNGAAGDFLSHVIVTPLTTSPGVVSISDGGDRGEQRQDGVTGAARGDQRDRAVL